MSELIESRSVFYRAFIRDGQKCVYCGRDMMESLDSFAMIDLDHLKPSADGGADDDVNNRVISCKVCNTLKAAFNPLMDVEISSENRDVFLTKAKERIAMKRAGQIPSDIFKDYQYWKNELGLD